jgi:hypothetical protein
MTQSIHPKYVINDETPGGCPQIIGIRAFTVERRNRMPRRSQK